MGESRVEEGRTSVEDVSRSSADSGGRGPGRNALLSTMRPCIEKTLLVIHTRGSDLVISGPRTCDAPNAALELVVELLLRDGALRHPDLQSFPLTGRERERERMVERCERGQRAAGAELPRDRTHP